MEEDKIAEGIMAGIYMLTGSGVFLVIVVPIIIWLDNREARKSWERQHEGDKAK